jgi:signal transduction histidine kinase
MNEVFIMSPRSGRSTNFALAVFMNNVGKVLSLGATSRIMQLDSNHRRSLNRTAEIKRGFRFWLVYTIAWLPYAVSYVAIFIQQGSSIRSAISDASSNIISAAVLGLGVLWICRRLPWPIRRRPWFFGIHLILAALYAVLWVSTVSTIFTLLKTIEVGKWTPIFLNSWALQWELFSGLMIYATLASVAYILQVTANLRDEERRAKGMELRAARAEALQMQTELTALRAKLNPHFLFNTLHTLMALVRDNHAEAEAAIERFSAMLRYVLRWETGAGAMEFALGETLFEDEWRFAQDYLALEHLRLGDRLEVITKIDPGAFETRLPQFSLQPLIENAIKHSVSPRARGGRICITASMSDVDLIVEVSDDGPGAVSTQVEESHGLGLRLIHKTLTTLYEGRAKFDIETSPDKGFSVRLRIPQERRAGAAVSSKA